MDLTKIIHEPWAIAGFSSFATAVAVPLFNLLANKLRSLFGAFSGQYIGYTWKSSSKQLLLEDVRCRHIGKNLAGKIYGVTVLEAESDLKQMKEIEDNKGVYCFKGFIDERLVLLSYRTVIPGVRSSGSITMNADSNGQMFFGNWAGMVGSHIDSAHCMWVKSVPQISSRKHRDKFIAQAKKFLSDIAQGNGASDKIFRKCIDRHVFPPIVFLEKSLGPSGPISLHDLRSLYQNRKHKNSKGKKRKT